GIVSRGRSSSGLLRAHSLHADSETPLEAGPRPLGPRWLPGRWPPSSIEQHQPTSSEARTHPLVPPRKHVAGGRESCREEPLGQDSSLNAGRLRFGGDESRMHGPVLGGDAELSEIAGLMDFDAQTEDAIRQSGGRGCSWLASFK